MSGLSNTQYFKVKTEPEIQVKEVLETVYNAMVEKGYNPVNQIVGPPFPACWSTPTRALPWAWPAISAALT